MNHRILVLLLSILTIAVVIGSGAYLEWPETASEPKNQPPVVGGTSSDSTVSTTTSLGQALPIPRLSPPPAESAEATFGPVNLWVGLKNSDDQGTQFDLRAEVYRNNSLLVAQGQTLCVTGVTRSPDKAKQVSIGMQPIGENTFEPGDVLSLKLLTRIGTTPSGTKCPGPGGSHASSTGLRLYFDKPNQASAIFATLDTEGPANYFLHLENNTHVLTKVNPVSGPGQFKDSSSIGFARGNPWSPIGSWSLSIAMGWQLVTEPVTGISLSLPLNLAMPPPRFNVSEADNSTIVTVATKSQFDGSFIDQFSIALIPNQEHDTLATWFQKNIDPGAALLSSGAFVPQRLPNGMDALILSGPLPYNSQSFNTGPVSPLYARSLRGDTILALTQSDAHELDLNGFPSNKRLQFFTTILGSLQIP